MKCKFPTFASFAILVICAFLGFAYITSPIVLPISLKLNAQNVSPKFRLWVDDRYSVEIETDRTLSADEHSCLLLGQKHFPDRRCDHKLSVIDVTWVLERNGKIIADHRESGKYNGSGWSKTTITRYIGNFTGLAGDNYQLMVSVNQDATALDSTNPRIVIRPDNWNTYLFGYGPIISLILFVAFIKLLVSHVRRCIAWLKKPKD